MTGIAHLYNWLGTDTVDAAYAAAHFLNDGRSFGACSVLASAHRSTTPWPREDEAYDRIVELFDRFKIISVVADTYGFDRGIRKLAQRAEAIRARGGWLVARPDSGDPVETTLLGLAELEQALGTDRQERGLKVLRGASIIQGDTMSDGLIFDRIYPAVVAAGFCPSNLVFGMGEQSHRAHRSETELAYKTALVGIDDPRFPSGYRENMKSSDDRLKRSIPARWASIAAARAIGSTRSRSTSFVAARRAIWSFCTTAGRNRLPVRRELFESNARAGLAVVARTAATGRRHLRSGAATQTGGIRPHDDGRLTLGGHDRLPHESIRRRPAAGSNSDCWFLSSRTSSHCCALAAPKWISTGASGWVKL